MWVKVRSFDKMDNLEYRAIIKFLHLEGENASQIHQRLVNVFDKSAPSYATVTNWMREFKRGREDIKDAPRPGRPSTETTEDNVQKVHQVVLENRKVSIVEIQEETGISYGTVSRILHEHLSMSKVCCRWVPRLLTREMKGKRIAMSRELLDLYDADPDEFKFRIVTGDETWVYYHDPETKMESMEWKHHGSPRTKVPKVTRATKKLMATVFWDGEGVIHIDYLPRGRTMNGDYYADLLGRLRESIKQKRRGKLRRGVWLQHDNAPVHTCNVATLAANRLGFETLPHPPYSPDLAPSDYFLFSKLKKELRGQRYDDDNELMLAVEGYFRGQCSAFFSAGINALPARWHKCLELEGDYVE